MSLRYPHPLHRVSLFRRNKKNTKSVFPHPFEYIYSVRTCIQGAYPERNHPNQFIQRIPQKLELLNNSRESIDNNYNRLDMSKKRNPFTSTNVAPRNHLNTQFEI